jgi:hypothetical protein
VLKLRARTFWNAAPILPFYTDEGAEKFQRLRPLFLACYGTAEAVPCYKPFLRKLLVGLNVRKLLVRQKAVNGGNDVFGLGQDFVFQLGLIGAKRVHSGYAADGRVQVTE